MKNIIQRIFFPDQVRGYYIFSKTVLGIGITDRYLYSAIVQSSGDKRTVSSCIQKEIPLNEEMSFEDRLTQGLQDIIQAVPAYDTIHISLPSNRIVFKSLTVPFLDREKIKMIAPFEVEEHLPFSLEHAVIDVIITSQNKSEKTSDIIVTATQHETLMPFIHACEKAGIMPEQISIDMFELFGLYRMIAKYQDIEGMVALIEINTTYTNILVIKNGALISMRTLKRGVQDIMHAVLGADASTENLNRIDLHAPENQKLAKPLLSDIQFTIQAILTNNDIDGNVDMAIIAGIGAEINGIDAYMHSFAHESTLFQLHNLIGNGNVSFKNHNHIAPRYITAVATAFPDQLTQSFDLRPASLPSPDQKTISAQIITSIILGLLIVFACIGYSYWQTSNLNTELKKSQQQVMKKLQQTFNLSGTQRSLRSARENAKRKLETEQSLWSTLAQKNRYSFLYYLQELSTQIDQKGIGLDLKRMSIQRDETTGTEMLKIEGSVRDYQSLRALEEALRETKLFATIPELQETKFNVTLKIEPETGDDT